MKVLREGIERWYEKHRDAIFKKFPDPEDAHEWAIKRAQLVDRLGLAGLLLGHLDRDAGFYCTLVNAAGSNKNGDIPAEVMRHLGFDINLVGTVTFDTYEGNERPRIQRGDNGIVNWMGLPGIGVHGVVKNLLQYGDGLDVRASIASTPGKQGDEMIKDMVDSMQILNPLVREYEVNISCPNTGEDAWYTEHLPVVMDAVAKEAKGKHLYVKLSPDHTRDEYQAIVDVCNKHVIGFTLFNTTKQRGVHNIPTELPDGGASGSYVKKLALAQQQVVVDCLGEKNGYTINICGGIDNPCYMKKRMGIGPVGEVQVYTGLIYKGPKLLRELKRKV
jgi:dihydroorotate dehydrogenase